MQIQNPTAVMIARTAVAQDDVSGYAYPPLPQIPKYPCTRAGRQRSPITLSLMPDHGVPMHLPGFAERFLAL